MEKGELFRVKFAMPNRVDNSYIADVFVCHAEDDMIVLCSEVDLTTGRANSRVKSFYKNHWNFFEVGPDIKSFLDDRLKVTIEVQQTEAATV